MWSSFSDTEYAIKIADVCSRSDIVGDFVKCLHDEEELRQCHRNLVDVFRTSRPVDLTSKAPEWNNTGNTRVSRYVHDYCAEHIETGWESAWESDQHAIQKWLGDYPQDDIVKAAASFLGFEKLSQLASRADPEDTFEFAKLAAAAGMCARRQTTTIAAGFEIQRKALDQLAALPPDRASDQRDYEERLELEMAGM